MTSATASAIRPSLRDNRQPSGSPHTPASRFISSTYSSPGSTFRQEEDSVIIELDPRGLSAGFEGESGPQCFIPFTHDNSRRVGDYRQWLPGHKGSNRDLVDEVSLHELWREDLGCDAQSFDLGLLEDKLERTVREAYNTYLLTDAGTARLVLVLPSIVPLPVLSSILTLLFERWKYASIALLPRPTMCLAAAGLRTGVVIDIGWENTTVTPIYEYRELRQSQSTRSMKMMTMQVGQKLRDIAKEQNILNGESLICDMTFIEDTIMQIASCETDDDGNKTPTEDVNRLSLTVQQDSKTTTIPWPTATTTHNIPIPKSTISNLVTSTFLTSPTATATTNTTSPPDDEELPLPHLLYHSLLHLTPDIRGLCLPRLVFVGKGASIPGLRARILAGLRAEIDSYGWTSVRGAHVRKRADRVPELRPRNKDTHVDASFATVPDPGKDYVEETLQMARAKEASSQQQQQPPRGNATHGELRAVESLGAWAGASLLTSLKVKGVVEIERNKFLDHGLAGASREADVSVVPQRMSSAAVGMGGAKGSERTSWTLGAWG